MTATTSLKLPDALKVAISQVAAFEGKTSHALMVETLETAMMDALARQQFYADGEVAYQETVHSNKTYQAADVKAFILARSQGGQPNTLKPVPLDPAKPMTNA